MEKLYGYVIYHKIVPSDKELAEWKPYPSHKVYRTMESVSEAIKNIRESSADIWGNKYKALKVYSNDEFEIID